MNVATAFWPGTVAVRVTAAPPGTIAAEASGGTSNSCIVMLPPVAVDGSTTIWYVPVWVRVKVSMNAPDGPTYAIPSTDPSGARTVTVLLGMVAEISCRLARWPATPSNTALAFSPAADVTVTGAPPAAIVGGTVPATPAESDPLAAEAVAEIVTAPGPEGV